jgi:hypothetical protein
MLGKGCPVWRPLSHARNVCRNSSGELDYRGEAEVHHRVARRLCRNSSGERCARALGVDHTIGPATLTQQQFAGSAAKA